MKTRRKRQKKSRKANEQKKLHPYVFLSLFCFFFFITLFKFGAIGQFLFDLSSLVFGPLYPFVYLLCALYVYSFFYKKKLIKLTSISLWFTVIFVWFAIIPYYHYHFTGNLTAFIQFHESIMTPLHAGIIGAFLFQLLSSLFDALGYVLFATILTSVIVFITFEVQLKELQFKYKKKRVEQALEKKVKPKITRPKRVEESVILEVSQPMESSEEVFEVTSDSYELPSLELLHVQKKMGATQNQVQASQNAKKLIEILETFGVESQIEEIHIGPTVTKYEIKPQTGVKVSKVANLQNDIKMALAAKEIRIEAPIPGKSAIGIEIPNVEKSMVVMKEVLEEIPLSLKDQKLLFALGKNVFGENVVSQLNKMPHLLIAGATGSGKSVCVNAIITSILVRATPQEVQMLLIDPKKVEFAAFKEIPHLLGPLITDPKDASNALKVIVAMMDERYDLFAQRNVKKIEGFYQIASKEERLLYPYIVVIVDELADLMMVASKEVEGSIQRITQLARAAGIHLIVATQRPSVDVITGVIKANIPSRIAFAVSSAIDSRTIIDQVGAERLLGNGDLLYLPIGENVVQRVQGVYVSDEEVQTICNAVKKYGKPVYNQRFLDLQALNDDGFGTRQNQGDVLYEEVKEYIIQHQKASTSFIQRAFSIGYGRAARLIDQLEQEQVIGPSRGSKPREVYRKRGREEYE